MKCINCKYFKQSGDWATDGWCVKDRDEEDCNGPYKSNYQIEADSYQGNY